jgi:polyisoprenoid-binding protein YceI
MTTEAATATPQTGTVTYRLVPEQSKFTVQAFAEGLFSAFGHDPVIHIRGFTGEVRFVPESFANASLEIRVDPNSLAVSEEVKEKDRLEIEQIMKGEVLESAKYNEIVFTSSNITVNKLAGERCRVRVIGELTLHGVTQKNLWISAEATVSEDTLRAHGDFSLKQSDFGIKPYSAAGGTIKLKNELKFLFEMVGKIVGSGQ